MRLADEQFTLELGSRPFTLRPTLRAAFDLNLKHDGFHNLSRSIAEGSFSACADLISASCINERLWTEYTVMGDMKAVREVLAARDQLLEFVLILTGANSKGDKPSEPSEPISFEEYHTKLFQIGTGWLLWSPETTWNATPAEIINAHIGRREMLTAVYGGKRDDEEVIDATDGGLDPQTRAELNAIGKGTH